MKRLEPGIIHYYNQEVTAMIVEKYGLCEMDALKVFVDKAKLNDIPPQRDGERTVRSGKVATIIE